MSETLHRFLVVGRVMLAELNEQHEPDMDKMACHVSNQVQSTKNRNINIATLAHMQKALHMDAVRKGFTPERFAVLDVSIDNIIYLGEQTDEEFNPPAESTPQ